MINSQDFTTLIYQIDNLLLQTENNEELKDCHAQRCRIFNLGGKVTSPDVNSSSITLASENLVRQSELALRYYIYNNKLERFTERAKKNGSFIIK